MGQTLFTVKPRSQEKPGVDIFGVFYFFRSAEANKAQISTGAKLRRMAKEISSMGLDRLEELNEKEAAKATELLDEFTTIILPELPAAVLKELFDTEKLSIAEVYITKVAPLTPDEQQRIDAVIAGQPQQIPFRATLATAAKESVALATTPKRVRPKRNS